MHPMVAKTRGDSLYPQFQPKYLTLVKVTNPLFYRADARRLKFRTLLKKE